MGFFDKFKSSGDHSEEDKNVPWVSLTRIEDLDKIKEESKERPVIIFKHSTRCGVSRGVLKSFEKEYNIDKEQVKIYFLDLLSHRDISNEIASTFGVRHESPQILIIKNGKAVFNESHHSIQAADIQEYL